MQEPLISLIIPVYNVEKYLIRCLDSVMAQEYNNFECILVDDGSKDSSGNICDSYAQKSSIFNVIHKTNGGVSSARNCGLDYAKGKYIAFCDSDDELESKYISSLIEGDEQFDLVITGVENIETNGRVHFGVEPRAESIEQVSSKSIQDMVVNRSINCVYSKRYRADIIEKFEIRFDSQCSLGEDTMFNALYLNYCNSILYRAYCEYKYYRYETDRNTLSTFNDQYVERLDKANDLIGQILCQKYPDILQSIEWKKRFWDNYYYGIFSILRDERCSSSQKMKKLRPILHMKRFGELSSDIDIYMSKDSQIWRKVIKSRNAFMIVTFWKITN